MEICKYCGNTIKDGEMKCSKCGIQYSPDEYKEHKVTIIIGYICSVIGFPFGIGGFIFGIYLITRPNKDVHNHGKIMCAINFLVLFILCIVLYSGGI